MWRKRREPRPVHESVTERVLFSLHTDGYRKTKQMLRREEKDALKNIEGWRLNSKTLEERLAVDQMFDVVETSNLLSKAERLNLKIPRGNDWWYPEDSKKVVPWEVLTKKGQRRTRKLIKEEHRKNLEWWVKVLSPILALIVSALGLILALASVARR